jgi:hypothetical protein
MTVLLQHWIRVGTKIAAGYSNCSQTVAKKILNPKFRMLYKHVQGAGMA